MEQEFGASPLSAETVLESITDAFVALDRTWRYTYVNRHAEELLGRSREALLGRVTWEIFPEATKGPGYAHLHRAVEAGEPVIYETKFAGSGAWFEVHAYPSDAGLTIYFRDVTERKRSEEALREREEQLRLITDALPVLISYVDREGRYRFNNAAYEQWFSASRESIRGRHLRDVLGEAAYERVRPYVDAVLAGRPSSYESTVPYAHGGTRHIRADYLPHQVDGEVLGYYALVTDITERFQKERTQQFLATLAQATQPLNDPGEIMSVTAWMLGEHLDVNRCAYAEVEADEDHFIITGDYTRGTFSIAGRFAMSAFGPEALRLMRANQPYVVNDVETDARVGPEDLAAYRHTEIAAVICVPLHKGGRVVAGMAVHQKTPRRWTAEEADLVCTVAGRCWESIERARMVRDLRESEERFRALVTASSDVVYRMNSDWSEMRRLDGRDFIADTHEPSRSWLQKYIHPDDQRHVLEAIGEAVRTRSVFELEHRVLRVDGTLGWTYSRAIPLVNPDGEIVEWFGAASDVTERKLAEETLASVTAETERQKRLYETIFSSTPDLIYVFDLTYRFTFVNDALLKMWGRSLEESIGKRLLEVGYEPWHAEMHEREIDQVVATKRPVRGQVPFPHATLGRRIYDYILVPVLNAGGDVEAIAGTTRDVTEIRQVEEALRESEERYSTLFESVDEGFCILEMLFDEHDRPVDYRFLEINPMFEKQTGLREALGRTARELVPDLEPHWFEIYGKVALTGEPVRFEQGSEAMGRWFDVYALRIGEPERRQVALLFKDVTEDRRTETVLRESEARFRNMADHAPVMVWVTDPTGYCTYLNRRWYEFTGQTEETALGLGWLDATHPDDRAVAEQTFLAANASREPFQLEYRLRGGDGVYRWAIDAAAPRFGADAAFLGYVGSVIDITERKEIEAALRENEARARLALDVARQGTWSWEPALGEVLADARCREVCGLHPDAALTLADIAPRVHPEDWPRVEAALGAALLPEGSGDYSEEFRFVHVDGAVRWVVSRGQTLFEGDEEARKPVLMLGSVLDVTGRKEAEARRQALIDLTDRWRDLDDTADIAFAAAEILGTTLGVSRVGYGIIDPVAETITIERDWNAPGIQSLAGTLHFRDYGSYIEDLKRGETVVFADAEKDRRTAATADALKAISAQAVVNMPVTEQGGLVALLYLNHATAREWSADELAFVREVAEWTRTAIERRRVEQQLREREAQFRSLADSIPQLAWMADETGWIFWYNRRWYEYTGTTFEAMEGWGWESVHDPNHLDRVVAKWKQAHETGDPWEDTFPLRGRDGEFRWFLSRAVPIRDEMGRINRWFGTNTDITEQIQAREAERRAIREQAAREAAEAQAEQLRAQAAELERSNRELQEFAYVASHDLQEPLRKITTFAGLVASEYGEQVGEAGRSYLERMQDASGRMSGLLKDLLAFSRVTTKPQPFQPVDLGRVMREVLSDLEVRIEETGGRVEVGALPGIDADATQMRQLLQNLIGNALKFRKPGVAPAVHVSGEVEPAGGNGRPGAVLRLTVSDNGIGFDEKYLDRIFSPFQRLHGKGRYEGTGMGLAICRRIAERHGGTITAESTPGSGSSFIVTLPVHQPGREA